MNTFLDLAIASPSVRIVALMLGKVTLILMATLAIARMLRRPAADRHRLLVAAFATLLLVPLATAVLPTAELQWLPAATSVAETSSVATIANAAGEQSAAIDGARATVFAPAPRVALWLSGIWLLGALLSFVPVWLSLAHRRALRRLAPTLDSPEWRSVVANASTAADWRHEVVLLAGGRGVPPMTWGTRPAVVLMPENATTWSDRCREAVLHHELSHARRRDAATLLWCRLVVCCYWFHPLVWMAYARLRVEQELAADEAVVQGGRSTVDYAESLLHVLRGLRVARPHPGLAATGHGGELQGRIKAILSPQHRRALTPLSRSLLLAAVTLTALGAAPWVPVARAPMATTGAAAHFRINWILSGQLEEVTLIGTATRADRLSTLQLGAGDTLTMAAWPGSEPVATATRLLTVIGDQGGSTRWTWQRNGAEVPLTAADRAWVDERLRYLVASLALRQEERKLSASRDSVFGAGGLMPIGQASPERAQRWAALEDVARRRSASMERRERLAASGVAPWDLMALDREALELSWQELEAAGVRRVRESGR